LIVAAALGLARLSRAGGRADTKMGVAASLGIAAAVTAAFYALAADVSSRPWILYALYMWSGLFASWVMVQLWTLLGRAHTVTQAKRLYGFIGAGAVIGAVLGAISARQVIVTFGARGAIAGAAVLFAIAALPAAAL